MVNTPVKYTLSGGFPAGLGVAKPIWSSASTIPALAGWGYYLIFIAMHDTKP